MSKKPGLLQEVEGDKTEAEEKTPEAPKPAPLKVNIHKKPGQPLEINVDEDQPTSKDEHAPKAPKGVLLG